MEELEDLPEDVRKAICRAMIVRYKIAHERELAAVWTIAMNRKDVWTDLMHGADMARERLSALELSQMGHSPTR